MLEANKYEVLSFDCYGILHVAESLFHDHAPAKGMGLDTAWIHRRAAKGGFGATPPAEAEPDLEVPDLESLVHALGLRGS